MRSTRVGKEKIEQKDLDSINGGAENTRASTDEGLTVPIPEKDIINYNSVGFSSIRPVSNK